MVSFLGCSICRVGKQIYGALFDRGLPARVGVRFSDFTVFRHGIFREAIRFFETEGYQVASGPSRFVEAAGGRWLWASFDGNRTAWAAAVPLFEEIGLRATFYVVPSEKDDALTPRDLRALDASGHVIGAALPEKARTMNARGAQQLARITKTKLEHAIGKRVVHLAAPLGSPPIGEGFRAYCHGIGFETIASAIPGLQHGRQRAGHLKRSPWSLTASLDENLRAIHTDRRPLRMLTGRALAD